MQNSAELSHKAQLQPTARSLPFLLMKARESAVAPLREMLQDTGLTEQQWRVLRVLDEYGPQDASHVADRSCLLISSLTRIASTMRNKGLISEHQDLNDRRRKNLAITEKGRSVLADNSDQANDIAARLKNRLGDADHQLLLDLLAKLVGSTESSKQG